MPSILPDFELPSNPDVKVRLREATVADAMDFSDIDPDCEEEATTLFLERLQERDTYTDPRRWTVEDRRFALFMYHLHTTDYHDVPLTYVCEACSEKEGREVIHTVSVSLAEVAKGYTPIEGKPLRECVHDGHAVHVHPVYGDDAELLEKLRLEVLRAEEAGTAERRKRNEFGLARLLASLDIPGLAPDKTEKERRDDVKDYLLAMPANEFRAFNGKIFDAIATLRHGLRSVYQDGRILLETPPVFCPEGRDKEGPGIRLQFPFRAFDYIPYI